VNEQFLMIPRPPLPYPEALHLMALAKEALRWKPKVRMKEMPERGCIRCSVMVDECLLEHAANPHAIIDAVGADVAHQLRGFLGAREAHR